MPKEVTPLTDTKIKNLKPMDKDYTVSDGNGLQLLIKNDGAKIWEFRFLFNGARKKATFGKYPQVSLKEARDKREVYQREIKQGINPIEAKREFKKQNELQKIQEKINQSLLFQNVAYEWLQYDKNQKDLVERHAQRKFTLFDNFIIPYFKDTDINDITSSQIEAMLQDKASTATETAHRIYQMMVNLYNYAIFKKYTSKNTMLELPKEYILKPIQKQHFDKITDEAILKELLNAIDNYTGWKPTKTALQFVAMIPLRANNLCSLKWEQIDFNKKILTIPRSQMKVRDKNLEDFKIPLSTQAIKLLEELKAEYGFYNYVFISPTLKTPINNETPNRALIRMGFNDDKHQRLHSFRGTFRSLVDTYQELHNATFETKERILDHHEKSQVVRAYSHKADYTEQMRNLIQWWSDYLDEVKGIK